MYLKFFGGRLCAYSLLMSPTARQDSWHANKWMYENHDEHPCPFCIPMQGDGISNTFIIFTLNWALAFREILLETRGIGAFDLCLLLTLVTKYLKRQLQIPSGSTTNWLLKSEASCCRYRMYPATLAELTLLQRESWHLYSVVETGLTTVTNFTNYLHSERKVLITNSNSVTKWIDHIKHQISAYLENSTI